MVSPEIDVLDEIAGVKGAVRPRCSSSTAKRVEVHGCASVRINALHARRIYGAQTR
jgi:hypothetical protein